MPHLGSIGTVAVVLAAAGLVALPGCATRAELSAPADPARLVGRWTVDLRASPGDAAYTQPFVVASVDPAERSIAGSFYNSTISWSRINTAWGKVVVTFVTSDGQGESMQPAPKNKIPTGAVP